MDGTCWDPTSLRLASLKVRASLKKALGSKKWRRRHWGSGLKLKGLLSYSVVEEMEAVTLRWLGGGSF